jgi:hypothetical protein
MYIEFNDPLVKSIEDELWNKICFQSKGKWYLCDGPMSLPPADQREGVSGYYFALTRGERARVIESVLKEVGNAE